MPLTVRIISFSQMFVFPGPSLMLSSRWAIPSSVHSIKGQYESVPYCHIGGGACTGQRWANYSELSTQIANIEKIKIISDWKNRGGMDGVHI